VNSKIKFFQSIHFKIALVFALLLLLTLEIVGAVFVRQLERQNLNTFKSQQVVQTYIVNRLSDELSTTNTTKADKQIKSTLSEINNTNNAQIRVIDNKGTIRGTNEVDNQGIVGQKTTDNNIKNSIYNNRDVIRTTYNSQNNSRYYTTITRLIRTQGNNSELVGVIYMRSSLDSVYQNINQITLIYVSATFVAIILGLVMAIIISRAITRPIDEMKKQTLRIARGDYSGHVRVYGTDELGQLASAVNNLSVRVEEAQESTESERRRLDSVMSHMTDGVIATDRRGNVTIINETAASFLDTETDSAVGKSILDLLDIRDDYTLRELLEDPDDLVLDFSTKEHDLILQS